MKKIIYLAILSMIITSCHPVRVLDTSDLDFIFDKKYFTDLMNEFYYNHLRYPESSSDYCYSIYKQDCLNDFKFARIRSGCSTVTFKSYDDYNYFVDSVYSYYKRTCKCVHYMDWPLFYRNMSENDMEYKDGMLIFHNSDKGNTYYTPNIESQIHSWLDEGTYMKDSSIWRRQQVSQYICAKLCSKDSIVINFPDSVFNKIAAHKKIFKMVDSAIINIYKMNPSQKLFYYGIRYYRNGKIKSTRQGYELPDEIVKNPQLIQYIDSCVHIDKRVDFLQFVFAAYRNG